VERRLIFPQKEVELLNWYWFSEGFSSDELEKVHKVAELFEYQQAVTFGHHGENHKIRKSKIKWLSENTESTQWIYDKLMDFAMIANRELWNFDLFSIVDSIQYTEYYEGGGHYDYHVDLGPGTAAHRKISIVVQLSDPSEYEGGNFEILKGPNPETLPKTKGAVILFPSYLLHRVTPVTKGTRRSLVIWLGGNSLR
jgi:PKHD-type hydroxylase